MKFSLLVYGAPHAHQAPVSALGFARAAVAAGHSLHRVFFYVDGVHNGNALTVPAQDEQDVVAEWAELSDTAHVELVVCIAAALKRGLIGAEEAERYEKSGFNLHPAFEIAGLGQLIDAIAESDRVVTFAS